jgi:NADH dehydrogenase FAD-containing subunit
VNGGAQGTKPEGVEWLRNMQNKIAQADSVLVVGGGALGVRKCKRRNNKNHTQLTQKGILELASDSADIYPEKHVTLIHSGPRLLPRFNEWMHKEATGSLTDLGIDIILGARVNLSTLQTVTSGGKTSRTVKTFDGRVIKADLIVSIVQIFRHS